MAQKVIDQFVGKNHFLSPYYIHPFIWLDTRWMSAQHALSASKTCVKEEQEWIRSALTPAIAENRGNNKLLGKETMRCTTRPDWHNKEKYFLEEIHVAKFSDPLLASLLRNTRDAILIERNWWEDDSKPTCERITKNWLGQILMKIRDVYM